MNDEVYVKLTQIRDDGKLSLSMKECDQYTGIDLNPERTKQIISGEDPFKKKSAVEEKMIITGAIDFRGEHIKMSAS